MTVYLLDTNVLLRYVDNTHPQHQLVWEAVRKLRRQQHRLRTTSQNCIELWNVTTRPINRNGFGKTPTEAYRSLRRIERLFPVLDETPAVYPIWRRLVVDYGVSGVQVHDAHLVATMQAHGVSHILTFNTADFARYADADLVVVDPMTV